jgi:ABC-type branched-subunit amino acid transport system substrate-binding protein
MRRVDLRAEPGTHAATDPPSGDLSMKTPKLLVAGLTLALTCLTAAAQQGVSKTEITLGSIQDLSGPLAGFGKQIRLGMMLRVDEVNEQGGINGRQLKLLIEDSAYDPRKWRTWARRRTWRRCRCSSRRTWSTSSRSPRRARCTTRSIA